MHCEQCVPENPDGGVAMLKDFGLVPCGQKNVDTLKIENASKRPRTLVLIWMKGKPEESAGRLHVHPLQAVVHSGHPARFTLTYLSHLENIVNNFYFNVLEGEKLVARLHVRAQSVGPDLSPRVHNVRFFCFRNVSRTVRHVQIANAAKCEAKFCFDLDEDYQHLKISQTEGVIPAGMKLALVFTFTPVELQVYHKKIFCIVQFHQPIIFNIWGVCKPKLRVDPQEMKFRFPLEQCPPNNYTTYMERMKPVKSPEGDRALFLSKCVEDSEKPANEPDGLENVNSWTVPLDSPSDSDLRSSKDSLTAQVVLTTKYLDIENSPRTPRATALVNHSKTQVFYFEWDHDPKGNFKMDPCKGFLDPFGKADFTVLFTPSALDFLYHVEIDVRVFPCNSDNPELIVDLPVSMSLRISGHSFPDDSCGWVPQCKITPTTLHLPSCVPDEIVHGTFIVEREGHLPVTFAVLPPKDPGYAVRPPLGYLSKNFQLFVVEFNSESKEEGLYVEDLKIKFNNSNSNCETIRLVTSVETPMVLFGSCNALTFKPIFPRSKARASVPIENPTNLHIRYEFVIPEDITWAKVMNPKGTIEPKSFGEVEVLFKPEMPCEYLDYIPCYLSSVSKPDRTHTTHLQLIGSSQFGYLVATPSFHDFGESLYLQEKSITVHLFNFSPSLLHFRLNTVHRAFPVGVPENDVKVTPSRGSVPAKGSLEVQVTITPHEMDIIQYAIICQNMEDDSEEALPQGKPTVVFSFQFEGVKSVMRVVDLRILGGGQLFSSHWIWKMLNIDSLNTALGSPSYNEDIAIKFPEAVIGSHSIIVVLLLESNDKEVIRWRMSKKLMCPCLEESVMSVPDSFPFCEVSSGNNLSLERKLSMYKRFITQLHVEYEDIDNCRAEWTLSLPLGKKVKMRRQDTLTLPDATFSIYQNNCFSLRPVFIGDLHPPLQLFWLYNNTHQSTSYTVEKVTFREPSKAPQRVLKCVNPNGTLPPFSSLPLAFLFRPNEIRSYSAEVTLSDDKEESTVIYLTGEGIFNSNHFSELAIPRTIPSKAILLHPQESLECCERCINIPCFRVFSQIKRIFYVRNHSETEAWSFRWHSFRAENIMSVRVEPAEGIAQPGCSVELTLLMRSFSQATFFSASIPCDVINYNQLKAYESSVRYREAMMEKTKDYFTVTEKGISQEVPEIPIKEPPQANHIFVTVNANIVSSMNIDQKFSRQLRATLKAEDEIVRDDGKGSLPKPWDVSPIQLVLESLLWNILGSNRVKEDIKELKASQDFNYLQILPESRKKEEQRNRRFSALPNKNQLQTLLEQTMREIISKIFISKKKKCY